MFRWKSEVKRHSVSITQSRGAPGENSIPQQEACQAEKPTTERRKSKESAESPKTDSMPIFFVVFEKSRILVDSG